MTARVSGVRAGKHARTRAALIDAAVDTCLRRGYENTTVDRIAAAAGVSPRTFSRYFASKDSVFVAGLEDLDRKLTAELEALPDDVGPLAAMRSALGSVLTRAHQERFHTAFGDRLVRIVRVVTASDALRHAAVSHRGPRVAEVMARRMGVGIEDRQLTLALALISVTVLHGWSAAAASDLPLDAQSIGQQVDKTFADIATLAADLAAEH